MGMCSVSGYTTQVGDDSPPCGDETVTASWLTESVSCQWLGQSAYTMPL